MNSIFLKKEQRLNDAILAYSRFEKSFPESERLKDFKNKLNNLNNELKSTQELQAKLDSNGL